MAGLQDIRRRIRSVKNTQQVTKAMKMISAVKLRKSQERLVALRPYASKMMEVVRQQRGRIKGDSATQGEARRAGLLLAQREDEKRIRVVVVTSDKGLCGGFNANVLNAAAASSPSARAEIVHAGRGRQAVGRKGATKRAGHATDPLASTWASSSPGAPAACPGSAARADRRPIPAARSTTGST